MANPPDEPTPAPGPTPALDDTAAMPVGRPGPPRRREGETWSEELLPVRESAVDVPDGSGSFGSAARSPGRLGSAPGLDPRQRMGRYEIERELARGGMGVVYVAWDPHLERRVALKVLPGGPVHAGGQAVERFVREARAVASLDHPGIVRVYDIGEQEDCVYFAMDLVEGGTLAQRIRGAGPMPPRQAAELLAAITRSLAAAHARGIVHRDMKPGNVLLEPDGTPRITDFGLATQLDDADSRLTHAGEILGTPSYMAPEQARHDGPPISTATDVYAVGVIAFELLTGRLPWDLKGLDLVLAKAELDPVSPRTFAPGVPADLDVVVCKAMARDPGDRYENATALADDLERFLRGEPILAQAPSASTRLFWFLRRNRRALPVWGGGLLALVAGAFIAWGATAERREEQARQAAAEDLLGWAEARMAGLREAGDEAGAAEAFSAFVATPEVQGTEALSRAWELQADRQADRDDRLSALAQAFLASRAPGRQGELLETMGAELAEARDAVAVAAVVAALERRGMLDGGSTDALRLQAWSSAADLRLGDAARQWAALEGADGPRARVARTLSASTPLPTACGIDGCLLFDTDSDGRPELLQWREGGLERYDLADPTAPPVRVPGSRAPGWLGHPPPAAGTRHLLIPREGGLSLVEQGGLDGAREPIGGLRPQPWFARLLGSHDVDGDGTAEAWLGADRTLYRVDRTPAGLQATQPAPALSHTNSDVTAMLHRDLDGDGVAEVLVSTAEWGSFAVHVLDPVPGGGLVERSRMRLGEVYGLAVLEGARPRVAALVRRVWTNHIPLLPDDPHFEGLVIATVGADGLEEQQRFPLVAEWPGRLLAGDLDGDGRTDLVVGSTEGLLVLVAQDDDGFATLELAGLTALDMVQVDDDPAMELVLYRTGTDQAWIAGAGDEAPPAVDRTPAVQRATDPPSDPALRAGWDLVEELASMGMHDAAAQQLWRQVALEPRAQGGAAALVRSMDLMAQASAFEGLEDVGRALVLRQDADQDDLLAAREILAKVGYPRIERALLERALTEPTLPEPTLPEPTLPEPPLPEPTLPEPTGRTPELVARKQLLDGYLGAAPVVLDLSEALDPRWRVLASEGLRHRAHEGLALSPAYHGDMLELPVVLGDGPLSVQVELAFEQVEWGGNFEIRLEPLSGDGASMVVTSVTVQGGQGWHRLDAAFAGLTLPFGSMVEGGELSWTGRFSGLVDPTTGDFALELREAGGARDRGAVRHPRREVPGPGVYRLVIASRSPSCGGGDILLRGITLQGAGVALGPAAPVDPVGEAALLVVSGWPERALETLGDRQDLRARRVRFDALQRLGDDAAATQSLRAAMADAAWDPSSLAPLLRQDPRRAIGMLAPVTGPDWIDGYLDGWACSLIGSGPGPDSLERVTSTAEHVERLALSPDLSDAQRRAVADVLLSHARAWQALDRPERARRSLARADAVLEGLDARDLDGRRLASRVQVERAALPTGSGGLDPAAVVPVLAQALERHPRPRDLLPRIQLDARFVALRETEAWKAMIAEVERPR